MNTRSCIIALAFAVTVSFAAAAEFQFEYFTLDVPEGFEGPELNNLGADLKTVAFAKPHNNGTFKTLLQGTTYKFAASSSVIPREHFGAAADKYVLELLAAVERRRGNFSSTKPTRVEIGGAPASRVTWKGTMEGKGAHGVMYCIIVGSHFIAFHTQDLDDAPPSNLQQAETAIKNVRLTHADLPRRQGGP